MCDPTIYVTYWFYYPIQLKQNSIELLDRVMKFQTLNLPNSKKIFLSLDEKIFLTYTNSYENTKIDHTVYVTY